MPIRGDMGQKANKVHHRAQKLEAVFGDRFPALIPWMPTIGVLIGLTIGGVTWWLFGRDTVLFREASLGLAALGGLIFGVDSQTQATSWIDEKSGNPGNEIPSDDMPHELKRRYDPREDVLSRRAPRL